MLLTALLGSGLYQGVCARKGPKGVGEMQEKQAEKHDEKAAQQAKKGHVKQAAHQEKQETKKEGVGEKHEQDGK